MSTLVEVREEIIARRKEMGDVAGQMGPERDMSKVTLLGPGDTEAKLAEMRRRDALIQELEREEEQLSHAARLMDDNAKALARYTSPADPMVHSGGVDGHGEPRPWRASDLRKALETNRGYKAFRDGTQRSFTIDLPNVDFKTIILVSGMTPQAQRLDVQTMGIENRTIADLMLQGNTDRPTIDYFEETTLTNAADTVAENAQKPESALAWTLRTETVRKVATWIPASKEAMDDIPMLESQIRGRLAYMVTRSEEAQVIAGDGVAPNILGLLARGTQTQAKGADPTPDAVYKAMQKVRGAAGTGFSEPTAVVFHPNDWTDVKLLRTVDGVYIWGNPSDEGPDRIWGLPVRQTTAMTEGTALTGAFRPEAEVFRREGITITVATEDGSDFLFNRVKIMAESRLALAVYRPLAFCTVTGI